MSLVLQALFKKYASTVADLDAQEAAGTADFNLIKKDLARNRTRDLKALAESMASRGLAHSGASLKGNTQLRSAYDRSGANADAQFSRLRNQIARNRLQAKNTLDEGKATSTLQGLLGL